MLDIFFDIFLEGFIYFLAEIGNLFQPRWRPLAAVLFLGGIVLYVICWLV